MDSLLIMDPGMFLFVAGALPTLIGIVYTTEFPSSNAHVVAPLVIGIFFLIVFALWETFAKIKHPLTPTYVFTSSYGRDLTAPCIALAVVNMFYYSSSILWPTMVNIFYSDGGLDWHYGILLSAIQGIAITTGAVLLAYFGGWIKHWQWQLTGSVFVMVLFGVLLALGNAGNKGLMIAFVFLSQTGYGWAIYLSIAISQMGVDHKNLGLSGGLSGAARFAGGSSKFRLPSGPAILIRSSCGCRVHYYSYQHREQVDGETRSCGCHQRWPTILERYCLTRRGWYACSSYNL
jgi:hypothetical protein